MTRKEASRAAALALAVSALTLALPSASMAADSGGPETASVGADHMRQHAKLARMQARASARWRKMSRAQRRRAMRNERRAVRRSYVTARAAAAAPSDVGQWDPPFVMTENYEGYAIHAAMLRTGKVLMWGYPLHVDQAAFRGNESYAWLWDPTEGYGPDAVEAVTPVINGENVSIYCSGMSFLPDGRVLVVGGTENWGVNDPVFTEFAGLNRALVFDPATETWEELPRPAESHGRWYPTQTLMADGRTFVISGLTDEAPGGILNDGHELFDAESGTFELLDSVAQQRSTELYPHLFTMPDGNLLMAGPDPTDSAILDTDELDDPSVNPWTDLPALASQRIGGNAVIVPEGPEGSNQVAAIGGRPYGNGVLPPAYDELIDLDDTSPSWSQIPGMNTPRTYLNTVQLPDRSMVAIGGDDRVAEWPMDERTVEIYDPVTQSWQVGPSQAETRGYHSTALLLPDGRVLSTGDDYNPTLREPWTRAESSPNDTGEIYSPPYLFRGPRPVIASAPEAVRFDTPFAVGIAGDVDEAVLIAPAAVTHANDMNQRLVPLQTVAAHPNAGVTLKSPPSTAVAPPGWYMLFLVNDGVPSVAKWVRLDAAAAAVPIVPDPLPVPPPAPDPDPLPEPVPPPLPEAPLPDVPLLPDDTPDQGTEGDTPGEGEPEPEPDGDPDPDGDPEPDADPAPDGDEPRDFAGPRLRLSFSERGWLSRLRRTGKLRVKVTVNERATVAFRLLRGRRAVARARVEMRRAGTRSFDLRPRRSTIAWLRKARKPKLRFSVVAVDSAKNDTAWTRLLKPSLRH